ncbi:MAG TPA: hypothetical protein VG675_12785 [Bryobacteraceae bacterium]|nr:hypothetical protein [Bryobacteraceae bacterium]
MSESTQRATAEPVRFALYYPYIHIRSLNWLKATLLCFRQVRRIVPNNFTLRDLPVIQPFRNLAGPYGPLLTVAQLDADGVKQSLARLHHKLEENLDRVVANYAQNIPEKYQAGPEAFEINKKILNASPGHVLADLLEKNGLGWYTRRDTLPDALDWLTVHPTLGSAIMTTLALSVSRLEGLDIVTPNPKVHQSLIATRESEIFDVLLGIDQPDSGSKPPVDAPELAQIVLTTGFDLTRLTPENIKNLLDEEKDLSRFLGVVNSFSSRIPAGLSAEERARRLKLEVDAVLSEWHEYHRKLPKFAREAIIEKAVEKVPEKLVEILPVATGATLAVHALGALPGLSVALVTAGGIRMYKERHGPYRFLNHVQKAVDHSIGSIYVPQWSQLAG